MADRQKIFISLKTTIGSKPTVFREIVKALSVTIDIVRLSSVYNVDRPAESLEGLRRIKSAESLRGYVVVVEALTDKPPREVFNNVVEVESQFQHEALRRAVSLNLLFYGGEVVLLPGLSIPHPEVHMRPEEIIPVAELQPDFVHPVLHAPVRQLAEAFKETKWGEFYSRGDTLLDFSQPRT